MKDVDQYVTINGKKAKLKVSQNGEWVQYAPIIHSKWNYDGTCDNCKAQVLSNHTKFCPACDVKMDGVY
jgi:Zn finger protein HypA/HybF involved in hydrogenase expression